MSELDQDIIYLRKRGLLFKEIAEHINISHGGAQYVVDKYYARKILNWSKIKNNGRTKIPFINFYGDFMHEFPDEIISIEEFKGVLCVLDKYQNVFSYNNGQLYVLPKHIKYVKVKE